MKKIKIKQKEILKKPIKKLDKKSIYNQKFKNNIVKIKEKTKGESDKQEDEEPTQYGINKIENKIRMAKQKSISAFNRYGRRKIRERTSNIKRGYPDIKTLQTKAKHKNIKMPQRNIKSNMLKSNKSLKRVKQTEKKIYKSTKKTLKVAKEGAKKTYQITKESAKLTAKGVKIAVKSTITAIKTLVTATKTVVSALLAGGWIAVVVIIVICVVLGAYALFFGGEEAEVNSSSIVAVALAEVRKCRRRKILEMVSDFKKE